MANPQIKNGYTRIANELLEAICRLNISGNEMRIVLYVIRRTFGFQRDFAEIPLSELSLALNMKKNNVSRSIKKLCEENILIQKPCQGNRPQTLSIVTDYEKWAVETCADSQLSKLDTVIENDNTAIIRNDNSAIIENDNPAIIEIDNSTVIGDDNHTIINKEKESIKENIKDIFKEDSNEKKPYGRAGKVFMTESEYEMLVDDYGKEIAERYIERMNNYIIARGANYRDCYAELMLWLDKDNVKKRDKNAIDISEYEWVINRFI